MFKSGRTVALHDGPAAWERTLENHRLALNCGRSVQGIFDESAVKAAVQKIADVRLPWSHDNHEFVFRWWRGDEY
jgi:hypothetical protein